MGALPTTPNPTPSVTCGHSRTEMRVLLTPLALCVFIASACSNVSPSPLADVSDDQILVHARNWPNLLGISADGADLWRERLNRACTEGVWDHDVAFALASVFMNEDEAAGRSVRVLGAEEPTVENAALALWLTAVNVCREEFPPESIDRGPPGLG